jgi:hypothetical protein
VIRRDYVGVTVGIWITSPYVYVRKTRLYTQVLPKNSVAVTQKIEHRVNYFTDSCDKRDKTPDGLQHG